MTVPKGTGKLDLRAEGPRDGAFRKNEEQPMETHFDAMQPQGDVSGEKVKEDLRTLMHDAEELLKVTAGDVSDKAKQARTRLAGALENAKATCARFEGKAKDAAKATDRVIRSHPYESIGLAFGVGLLVGVLLGRK